MSASFSQALTARSSKQLLASVWQRNLPLLRDRLARLDAAALQSSSGQLSPKDRTESLEIAHKLAGSLGMFGYLRGTEIARQLEVVLDSEGPVQTTIFLDLTQQLERELGIR